MIRIFYGIAAALLVVGAAILVLPSGSTAAAHPSDPQLAECPNAFVGFKQSVNWYQGKNRLQVKADLACGTKFGEMYELKNVSLEIKSGRKTFADLKSANGTYWPKKNLFLISDSKPSLNERSADASCIRGAEPVLINLQTAELRTSGIRKNLNTKRELSCARKF